MASRAVLLAAKRAVSDFNSMHGPSLPLSASPTLWMSVRAIDWRGLAPSAAHANESSQIVLRARSSLWSLLPAGRVVLDEFAGLRVAAIREDAVADIGLAPFSILSTPPFHPCYMTLLFDTYSSRRPLHLF